MRQVFEYYDRDRSGKINYKEFIAGVLFEPDQEEELSLGSSAHKTKDRTQTNPETQPQLSIELPGLQRQPNSLKVEPSTSPSRPEPPNYKFVKLGSG